MRSSRETYDDDLTAPSMPDKPFGKSSKRAPLEEQVETVVEDTPYP